MSREKHVMKVAKKLRKQLSVMGSSIALDFTMDRREVSVLKNHLSGFSAKVVTRAAIDPGVVKVEFKERDVWIALCDRHGRQKSPYISLLIDDYVPETTSSE